jgi:hypothetical protein
VISLRRSNSNPALSFPVVEILLRIALLVVRETSARDCCSWREKISKWVKSEAHDVERTGGDICIGELKTSSWSPPGSGT